jgi:hypothetical protein
LLSSLFCFISFLIINFYFTLFGAQRRRIKCLLVHSLIKHVQFICIGGCFNNYIILGVVLPLHSVSATICFGMIFRAMHWWLGPQSSVGIALQTKWTDHLYFYYFAVCCRPWFLILGVNWQGFPTKFLCPFSYYSLLVGNILFHRGNYLLSNCKNDGVLSTLGVELNKDSIFCYVLSHVVINHIVWGATLFCKSAVPAF